MSTVGTKRSAPSRPVEKTAFGRMPAGKEPTAVVYDRSGVVTEHKFALAKYKGIWASMMAQRNAGYYVLYDMQPVDRAGLVKGGVPSRFVGSISTDMGVTKDRFVKITGLSKATINRKIANKTNLSADESEKLVGLGKLIGQVESIVKESGSPEGFKAAKWFGDWIVQPAPALGGRKPEEFLDTSDGRDAISKLLAQIQSGAYA